MEIKLAPESIDSLAKTAEGICENIFEKKLEATKLVADVYLETFKSTCATIDKYIEFFSRVEIEQKREKLEIEKKRREIEVEREKFELEERKQELEERKAEWELKDLRKKIERAKLEKELKDLKSVKEE